MDWKRWIEQSFPSTDIQRGGATVWPRGESGLIGDILGPIMHSHDGASEIFYFVSGQCRLEIGDSEEIFNAGDFVLVPPEVPHNLWNAGDDDLCVFWLVAPNFTDNVWRTEDFAPGAMSMRAIRGSVTNGETLPSDENIRSQRIALEAGQSYTGETAADQEAVIYLVEGGRSIAINGQSQQLGATEFAHVPPGSDYRIDTADQPALLLLFEMPGR